jgi:hypothetical protein
MSTNLMITMLRKGKTASEIMNILDAISGTDDVVAESTDSCYSAPTLEEIEF